MDFKTKRHSKDLILFPTYNLHLQNCMYAFTLINLQTSQHKRINPLNFKPVY